MGCEHVFVYADTTWDRGPEHGYITTCTRCGTPGRWVDGEWRTDFETEGSRAIAQLNEVRVLCGGEDPVEWIQRAQRGRDVLHDQLERCITTRDPLLDLVQRLLEKPARDDPIEVRIALEDEARAKVAELRKGEDR